MADLFDHEEIPIPLTRRRSSRPPRFEAKSDFDEPSSTDDEAPPLHGRALEVYDRMTPKVAGGLMGLCAGAAGLGVIHLVERARLDLAFSQAAANHGLERWVAIAIGYGTAAAAGALVGACFATVTRHLRRFLPLLFWALVFFGSLTLLVLAISRSYGNLPGSTMVPAVLAAAAAYAIITAFQLPLRKRAPR